MVGIVLVSHSRKMGEAVLELARQMCGPDVPIEVAAGVGDDRSEFGTDAVEISEAIQRVYNPDGVLVLMDLGSALLSAEMALDLIPEDLKALTRICPAPFVEGAIVAAVQAGLGNRLEDIYKDAVHALVPKIEQVGGTSVSEPTAGVESQTGSQEIPKEVTLQIKNIHGLHARPAAKFVQTAARFEADIQVRNNRSGKGPVSARSLNAIATLGAMKDDPITIYARGRQADEALKALHQLVVENFGEPLEGDIQAPELAASLSQTGLEPGEAHQVVPVSTGIAIGPLAFFHAPTPEIPHEPLKDPQAGWDQWMNAVEKTRKAIQASRDQIRRSVGTAEADIFEAHLLILDDPELLAQVRKLIFEQKRNPAEAWNTSIQEAAGNYRQLPDEYMRQRAQDVLDVGSQVLLAMVGITDQTRISFPRPSVLFSRDLTPNQMTQLKPEDILGMLLMAGGPTSHSSILARAMGIPAVTGVDSSLQNLPEGTLVALDGSIGLWWDDPQGAVLEKLEVDRRAWLAQRAQQAQFSHLPAVTRDGHKIAVFANIGGAKEAQAAVENGAEGIGLLRTEFLYLSRETAPTEKDQFEALDQIGRLMGTAPVVVRTLDIGGDKPVPYVKLPEEANPFLGVRAIRLSFQEPDLFIPQLRAILRASREHNLQIMFPMIASLEEVLRARRALDEVHQALITEGIAHSWPIQTGIMVEIPSAALMAPLLARHVDFFSIGTNDLTQYTLAAERGNPALASLADGLHPAVLKLVSAVADAAHHEGKIAAVCGELGGDPAAIPILIGLGIDELSMNVGSIPDAKALINRITFSEAQNFANRCLSCEQAAEVRAKANEFLKTFAA